MKGTRDGSPAQKVYGFAGQLPETPVAQDAFDGCAPAGERGPATGESADFAVLYRYRIE